jgi:outer membrane protein TolC
MDPTGLKWAMLLTGLALSTPGCQSTRSAPEARFATVPVLSTVSQSSPGRVSSPDDAGQVALQANGHVRPVHYAREVGLAAQGTDTKPPLPAKRGPEVVSPGQAHGPPCQFEVDFATALWVASGQNPRVAFAQERVNASFARLRAAQVLWLPSIQAGVSYYKSEGSIQDVGGNVFDVSRGALNTGLGAGIVGAGVPRAPGVVASFAATDALFQPRIAAGQNAAGQAAFNATMNDTLLETSLAYLALLRAMQQQTIAEETLRNARQLADLTNQFWRAGQGAQADADRAATELVVRQNNVARSGEAVQVASARLAELLNIDATVSIRPMEPAIVPIELISPATPARELVATALSARPELHESRALVSAAVAALRREEYAPLVPSVLFGISETGFGGGKGDTIANFHDRFDLDAMAVWQIRNLGFGERAARDEASARLRQARHRDVEVMNRVAREVVEAHAQVQARQNQIATAELGIKSATDSYRRNLERIRGGQGLPIEALQAIQALDQSRQEYLRAVADYSEAQFRLYRALGWPIGE